MSDVNQTGIVATAVQKTPSWVLAFCGGMVVLSVCTIAILQLGGFSGPLGRILNAEASKIERAAIVSEEAALRLKASASSIEEILERLDNHERRIERLESRVDRLEDNHD